VFVQKSIEVPKTVDINNTDTVEFFHSIMEIHSSTADPYHLQIPASAYEYIRGKLTNYFGAENVRFNSMRFVSHTYSLNLYQYVQSYEGYSDDYSVRLDQPNYTNIVGGVGIFGAILSDSVNALLPY
jgi:hypothetical protein